MTSRAQQPDINIKHGIPIPEGATRGGKPGAIVRAMRQMKIGDCIDVPAATGKSNINQKARISGMCYALREVLDENGFTVLRIWKTAERENGLQPLRKNNK